MDVRSLAGTTARITGAGSGPSRAAAPARAPRGADLAPCDLDAVGSSRQRSGQSQQRRSGLRSTSPSLTPSDCRAEVQQ
jgi:hypothetical protein